MKDGKTLHKFTEDSPKPVFGDRVYNLNTDGAQALSGACIDFNFADLIVRERKENGKFGSFGDFEDRMDERFISGRVLITGFNKSMQVLNNLFENKKITL